MPKSCSKKSTRAFTIIIACFSFFLISSAIDQNDLIKDSIPGYDPSFSNRTRVFAGFLNTTADDVNLRKLHYVFIENYQGPNNNMPVTLWLNGGPGCASKIGFLQ